MFEQIGKKIKSLCKIVFYVIIGISVIIGFILGVPVIESSDEGALLGVFIILLVPCIGAFISWIMVLFLYAFGELVDTNLTIVKQNKDIISKLSNKNTTESKEEVESSVLYFPTDN